MKKSFFLTLLLLLCLAVFASSASTLPKTEPSFVSTTFYELSIPSTTSSTTTTTTSTSTTRIKTPTTMPSGGPTRTDVSASSFESTPETTLPDIYPPWMDRPTTTTLACGNDENVCYVEFDITGDQVLECCNADSNPTCALCLLPCSIMCHDRNEGVKYCFGTDITYACECTEGKEPTCYSTTTTSTTVVSTTYAGIADATRSNKPLFYFIFLGLLLLVLAFLMYYVRAL